MNLGKTVSMWLLTIILSSCALAELEDAPGECEPTSWDAEKDEFGDVFDELNAEFGADQDGLFTSGCGDSGKADFFDSLPEPCDLLAPLLELGDDLMRAGFILGVEGEGVLGATVGFGGFDLVWDLYHQQMTVSRYAGAGFGFPGFGASVQAYTGLAFGFEHGVSDWDGYFVTANVEIGLPFLKEFVSLNPSVYVTGEDADENGFVDPTEVLLPPDGIYGFTIGVSGGFNLVPELLPVSGSITQGRWQPYKSAIRHFYDRFRNTQIAYVIPMKVRLVDHHDGTECHANWPEQEEWRDCVIEFGDPDESYLKRSLNTAYSICDVSGGCALPLTWPIGGTAIAIAALRSSGASFSSFCPSYGTH